MNWEPEDGRCRECGGRLETDTEQLVGACYLCDLLAQEEYDDERDEEDWGASFFDEEDEAPSTPTIQGGGKSHE